MADDEKVENSSTHGTEWEVVSLTASAYAAAPGPRAFDPTVESKKESDEVEPVASPAMFMSDHFLGSPSQHRNLPVEQDLSEIHNISSSLAENLLEQQIIEAIRSDEKGLTGVFEPDKDDCKLKSNDGLHEIQFIDQGEHILNDDTEFGQAKAWEGSNVVGEEQNMYANPSFSTLHGKIDKKQSVLFDENVLLTAEPNDPSLGYSSYDTDVLKPAEDDKIDASPLPYEAWWKRHAMSIYNHAKESNKLWHVVFAAALMGFAILGQRWQKEKLNLQLKWLSISDETLNQMLVPFGRFKDVLVGGPQRNLFIRGRQHPSH